MFCVTSLLSIIDVPWFKYPVQLFSSFIDILLLYGVLGEMFKFCSQFFFYLAMCSSNDSRMTKNILINVMNLLFPLSV